MEGELSQRAAPQARCPDADGCVDAKVPGRPSPASAGHRPHLHTADLLDESWQMDLPQEEH